jgi:L-asparaginase II
VHNNCSGKHAGFLLLAQACGDALAAYLDPDSRAQRAVNAAVAEMAGLPAPLPAGADGCGAPTLVLPLAALARAFGRLANPERLAPVRAAACRRILAAVGHEPVLLAGEQRLCTALVRTRPGAVFAKNGAEGVYAVALSPDPSRRWPGALGVAVKVDDGQTRAYQPVVIDLLRWLGVFGDGALPEAFAPFWRPLVYDTRKQVVGDASCVVSWPEQTR